MKYWNALIGWSGWKTAAKWWDAFIHWGGWSGFVHWSGWKVMAHWTGWKKIFRIHPLLTVLLTVLSAAGLTWVFAAGLDTHAVAYVIYCAAFYTLVVLLLRLPEMVSGAVSLVHRFPLADRVLGDRELRFRMGLYREQLVNFGYGVFKCAAALFFRDAWMGTEGFYNLVQGFIQLVQILKRRKNPTLQQQWKSYRLCGYLMFALHLSTTGLAFLMIRYHMAEEYPGFMIFATAAFTFYKLIKTFLEVAKDRKHTAPIDSSVRLLELSQAVFNLFCLQVARRHAFGGDFPQAGMMNTLTGTAVSVMMAGTGIYMLRRSKRELRKQTEQEENHGQPVI